MTVSLLYNSNLLVGQESTSSGAASLAQAGSNVCLVNEWTLNNNPAGLSQWQDKSLALSYRSDYLIPELSSRSLAFNYPMKNSGFGLSIYQFGYSKYNEQAFGLSYGMQLNERFAAGVQLNYQRLQLSEPYGSSSALSAKVGFLSKLSEKLQLGAVIINPNRAKKGAEDSDIYPQIVKLGVHYRSLESLSIHFQVDKQLDKTTSPSMGIDYRYSESFHLRIGYRRYPDQFAFGLSHKWDKFQVDLASSFSYLLGFSPAISIVYKISE